MSLPELPDGLRKSECSGNHVPDRLWNEAILDYANRVKAIVEKASKDRIVQRCRTSLKSWRRRPGIRRGWRNGCWRVWIWRICSNQEQPEARIYDFRVAK
jgi:hypothetical protein